MSVMFILISASLVLALGFLIAFIWSVRSGQYEDDYTPSVRMLFEETKPANTKQEPQNQEIENN
jgi:cbb3-type cytochrome oxidase maturation protein